VPGGLGTSGTAYWTVRSAVKWKWQVAKGLGKAVFPVRRVSDVLGRLSLVALD